MDTRHVRVILVSAVVALAAACGSSGNQGGGGSAAQHGQVGGTSGQGAAGKGSDLSVVLDSKGIMDTSQCPPGTSVSAVIGVLVSPTSGDGRISCWYRSKTVHTTVVFSQAEETPGVLYSLPDLRKRTAKDGAPVTDRPDLGRGAFEQSSTVPSDDGAYLTVVTTEGTGLSVTVFGDRSRDLAESLAAALVASFGGPQTAGNSNQANTSQGPSGLPRGWKFTCYDQAKVSKATGLKVTYLPASGSSTKCKYATFDATAQVELIVSLTLDNGRSNWPNPELAPQFGAHAVRSYLLGDCAVTLPVPNGDKWLLVDVSYDSPHEDSSVCDRANSLTEWVIANG